MTESLTVRRVHAVNTRAPGRVLLVAALLAFAGGCTGQFLYNRLDFLIPFYFGQRVTLDEAQGAQLKAAVQSFTAWHRSSQLQRYGGFLRDLADRAQRPTTRAEIEASARAMEGFWDDMVAELLPEGGRWLRSLTAQQVEELIANLAEEDEDEYAEHCEPPPEKRIARRAKTMKRAVKQWTGSLDDAQEAVIERTAKSMRLTGCAWLESRTRWRAELKDVLAQHAHAAASQARLRTLMLEPNRAWTDEYRQGFEANRAMIIDMLTELDASWSEKQRQSIVRRLTGIADDLDELAAG